MTPLMLACYFNNSDIVSTLLQANANIMKEDINKCTALCYGMAYAMYKNITPPHPVVEKLIVALKNSNVDFKSFFKVGR